MFRFMIHNRVPATMKYNLNEVTAGKEKTSTYAALRKLLEMISDEKKNLWMALVAILINSTNYGSYH